MSSSIGIATQVFLTGFIISLFMAAMIKVLLKVIRMFTKNS